MRLYFRRILQPSIDPFTEQMCFDTSSTGFFSSGPVLMTPNVRSGAGELDRGDQ